jgi:hypothetical protein
VRYYKDAQSFSWYGSVEGKYLFDGEKPEVSAQFAGSDEKFYSRGFSEEKIVLGVALGFSFDIIKNLKTTIDGTYYGGENYNNVKGIFGLKYNFGVIDDETASKIKIGKEKEAILKERKMLKDAIAKQRRKEELAERLRFLEEGNLDEKEFKKLEKGYLERSGREQTKAQSPGKQSTTMQSPTNKSASESSKQSATAQPSTAIEDNLSQIEKPKNNIQSPSPSKTGKTIENYYGGNATASGRGNGSANGSSNKIASETSNKSASESSNTIASETSNKITSEPGSGSKSQNAKLPTTRRNAVKTYAIY